MCRVDPSYDELPIGQFLDATTSGNRESEEDRIVGLPCVRVQHLHDGRIGSRDCYYVVAVVSVDESGSSAKPHEPVGQLDGIWAHSGEIKFDYPARISTFCMARILCSGTP